MIYRVLLDNHTLAVEGIKGVCAIPLVNRGRALGILSISRKTEIPFTSDDIDFLSRASGQIAIEIENALAHCEISELKDKLSRRLRGHSILHSDQM